MGERWGEREVRISVGMGSLKWGEGLTEAERERVPRGRVRGRREARGEERGRPNRRVEQ